MTHLERASKWREENLGLQVQAAVREMFDRELAKLLDDIEKETRQEMQVILDLLSIK